MRIELLDAPVEIRHAGVAPPFDDAVEARVAEIWEAERHRRGDRLYDGVLLDLVDRDGGQWECRSVRYRHLVAASVDKEMASLLNIRALGVTGCIACEGGYVIGRRADHVLQEPGRLEFAPAGGLDDEDIGGEGVDPLGALTREWTEEIGGELAPLAEPARMAAVIEDEEAGVVDLIYTARLDQTAEEIAAIHRANGSGEYAELLFAEVAQLADMRGQMGRASALIVDSMLQNPVHWR